MTIHSAKYCVSRIESKYFWAVVFMSYFGIWLFVNYLALVSKWWYSDDFSLIVNSWTKINALYLSLGRPLLSFWAATLFIDNEASKVVENIVLRISQGAFHVFGATLIGYLLSNGKKRLYVLIALLPFLIWPFNGAAVLWRTAAIIPIANVLSLLGLHLLLVRQRNILGIVLGTSFIILAMLSHQTGALGAIVVLCIISITEFPFPSKEYSMKLIETWTILLWAYLLGGISSLLIANSFGLSRTTFAINTIENINYLMDLNHLFLAGDFYPRWLKLLQITIVCLLVLLIEVLSIYKSGSRIALVLFALTIALFVSPWITLLFVVEHFPSWRVMYLAPLIFSGLFLKVFSLIREGNVFELNLQWPIVFLIWALAIGYATVGWDNSKEYVQLFQADLKTLNRAEKLIEKNDLSDQLCIITAKEYVRGWNPYNLKYIYADEKLSSFIVPWAAPGFVSLFSNLAVTTDPVLISKGIKLCQTGKANEAFQMFMIFPENSLCVCP